MSPEAESGRTPGTARAGAPPAVVGRAGRRRAGRGWRRRSRRSTSSSSSGWSPTWSAARAAGRLRPSGSGRSRRSGCRRPTASGWRCAGPRAIGADALAAGEVGVILVAGGSGTRLGFEGPKGTFPIGPVSSASLFQIHAEKIVALSRRHRRTVPLYIMTSPENHEATVEFFEANDRFGLEHVRFFVQGQMPAVDRAIGQGAAGREGPRRALARRPRRDARRPWPRRARRGAELPGRDARAGRPDAVLLPGGQPAGPDRRPGVHRPASRGRRRDVVQGGREALARREAGRGRQRGRPAAGDRVLRPARRAGRPARARGPAGTLGRQHRRAHPRADVHRAAGRRDIACPFHRAVKKVAVRGRRRAGRQAGGAERRQVRAVHLRRAADGPSAGPWWRPIVRPSSSRSRTPSVRTRPPRCTSG